MCKLQGARGAVPRIETVVSGSSAKQLVQPPKSPMSDGCCSAESRLYGSIAPAARWFPYYARGPNFGTEMP